MKATEIEATQMNRRHCFTLSAFLLLVACDSHRDAVRRVQQMTVPAGDTGSEPVGPVTGPQSVEFAWDVDTRLSWDGYADWVTARLVPTFRLVQRTSDRVVFSGFSGGDAHRLDIAHVGGSATTHAHVTFTSSPD